MAKKATSPVVGQSFTIQGFVGRLRDFDLEEDGVVTDYAYAFGITSSHGYLDVALFDDARGWVEGEILNAETGRFNKVEPLRNGDYVRVTGRYNESEWTRDGKSGLNQRLKVTVPRNIQKLKAPEKRTQRVKFLDDGSTRQAKPKKDAAPDAV